jgi:hypothetical protein
LLVVLLSIAAVLYATAARADDEEGRTIRLEAFAGGVGGVLTTRPTQSSGFSTPGSLSYPGLGEPSVGGGGCAAGGFDLHGGLRMRGAVGVDVPLLGLRVVWLTDDARMTLQGSGQTAAMDLREAVGTVALPGLGAHVAVGPLVVKASIQPVLQWVSGSGTVTQGFISADISAYPTFDLGVDANMEGCVTFGRDTPAVCAVAEPLLWRVRAAQSGAYNGVLFGLGVQVW